MNISTLSKIYDVIAYYKIEYRDYLLLSDDYGFLANRLTYCFEMETPDVPED